MSSRDDALQQIPRIRVSLVGHKPSEAKFAMLVVQDPAAARAEPFIVRRANDDREVFRSAPGESIADADSGDTIRFLDFSPLNEPGQYRIEVPGVGISDAVYVGADVYAPVFRAATRFFTGQRCGIDVSLAPDFPQYTYRACHLRDAEFDASSGRAPGKHVSRGGWHDAGDYGRYVVNSGITTGTMLWAFEMFGEKLATLRLDIPETGKSNMPDFLGEIRWNLEWMLTMQDDADGGVWHKATSANFCGFVMPPDDALAPLIIGTGSAPFKPTAATADFAAVFAIASRVFGKYDAMFADRCRAAAERAWAFATANPAVLYARNPQGILTGGYGDKTPADELLWASAELFRATGRTDYHDYFLEHFRRWEPAVCPDEPQWWADVRNMGMFTYAMCDRAEADAKAIEKIKSDTAAAADAIVARAAKNGYRLALRPMDYIWGSNAVVANYALMLLVANRFSPKAQYVDAAHDQLHYLLGRNTFGTSFVTHVGTRFPMHPHHRPSGADKIDAPWPGMLVGGPNAERRSPPARQWEDVEANFRVNEVAINWNAPLVFVLAAVM